jgi:hypothetical protein
MRPSAFRKCGVLIVAAVLTTAFAWNAAQGQFRPPRSPIVRPPGMNPPGMQPPRIGPPAVGPSTTVWKCPKCGYEYRGAVPPSTCPGCQSQMSNGMGNGIPGPGGRMNPNPIAPGAPAFVPPAMNANPPVMNPPVANPNPPVVNPNPPVPNFTPPAANVPDVTNAPDDSAASSGGLSRGKIIALVVGVIIVGLSVLVGGTCLLIYTLKGGDSRPRPRRRPRRDDY